MLTAKAASNSDMNMSAGEIRTVAWAWRDLYSGPFFFLVVQAEKIQNE